MRKKHQSQREDALIIRSPLLNTSIEPAPRTAARDAENLFAEGLINTTVC